MAKSATNTSRRAVVAGLALSPVAAVPAVAGVLGGPDPVLEALAKVEALKAERERAGDAHLAALDALEAVADTRSPAVEIDSAFSMSPVALRTPEAVDEYFDKRGLQHWTCALGADMGPAAHAAWEALRATTHQRLRSAIEGWREVRARFNLDALEKADEESYEAWSKAERAALATAPTTLAGAKALLGYVRQCMSEDIDPEQLYPAIENVEALVGRYANV